MSESGKSGPRRFVVDTDVFVAAIKPFSRLAHDRASFGTKSLALMLRLINDDELELFANRWLLDEYKRLGEELSSQASELILGQLTAKMREATELEEKVVARCRPYLPEGEDADVLHAATCLRSRAVLITNDKDFDKIKASGVIEVWSISDAIRKLSIR
jgi:predicted nucleic acid-binding protein